MKIIKEDVNAYYLIQITRVDNNKLLRTWKSFEEEEAWTIYEKAKIDAKEDANYYETLLELSITIMGDNQEELAVEYFDSDLNESLKEMVPLTEAILNEKLNLS